MSQPTSSPDSDPPTLTLNIPQLLLVLLATFFAIRYFFFSSSSPSNRRPPAAQSDSRGGAGHARAANPAHVEQIAQMFPQLSRRDIAWDLQRNGGSVAGTTERILRRGVLDAAPPSFQPPAATLGGDAIGIRGTPGSLSAAPGQSAHPDLITRYNLAGKVGTRVVAGEPDEGDMAQGKGKSKAWSANKVERQALLQKRREEMVLKARRRMEEREREKAETGESGKG